MKLRTGLSIAAFVTHLIFSPGVSAVPINGDFSAGFTGWEGDILGNLTSDTGFTPPDVYTSNFEIVGGAAKLSTDDDTFGAGDVFFVSIFQVFALPVLGPGDKLFLDYSLVDMTSDPLVDEVVAQVLGVTAGNPVLLMVGATSVDLTDLANVAPGQNVDLGFGISDSDGLMDMLTGDDFALRIVPADVPEPATLVLMALGLAGIGFNRGRNA